MKRYLVLAAVITMGVLLVPVTGAAKSDPHVYKFNGIVKGSDVVFTDVKGDGPSPGDIYTFTLTAYDTTGQHKTGTAHGYCVLGAPTFSTCTSVSDDSKGKIVLTWEDDGNASTTEHLAITGGTGKYRTLRGDGTSKQISASDPNTFRVKLNGNTR